MFKATMYQNILQRGSQVSHKSNTMQDMFEVDAQLTLKIHQTLSYDLSTGEIKFKYSLSSVIFFRRLVGLQP